MNAQDWLSIPLVRNALRVLAAGVVIPFVFGIIGRLFFKRDDDDEKNHPERARRLRQMRAEPMHDTPEPNLVNGEPWPSFSPSGPSREPEN